MTVSRCWSIPTPAAWQPLRRRGEGSVRQVAFPRDFDLMEACYRETCGRVLVSGAVEKEFRAQERSLSRVEISDLSFGSADAAGEAFLCLSEEEEDVGSVAARAGVKPLRQRLFLRDLPDFLRTPVFSATSGEVLRPRESGGTFHVVVVHEKEPADIEMPEVRSFLEGVVQERAFSAMIDLHIRWSIPRGVSRATMRDNPDPSVLSFLEFFPEDSRKDVLSLFREREFPFGECIVREGEPAEAFYLITSGRARVIKAGPGWRGDSAQRTPLWRFLWRIIALRGRGPDCDSAMQRRCQRTGTPEKRLPEPPG